MWTLLIAKAPSMYLDVELKATAKEFYLLMYILPLKDTKSGQPIKEHNLHPLRFQHTFGKPEILSMRNSSIFLILNSEYLCEESEWLLSLTVANTQSTPTPFSLSFAQSLAQWFISFINWKYNSSLVITLTLDKHKNLLKQKKIRSICCRHTKIVKTKTGLSYTHYRYKFTAPMFISRSGQLHFFIFYCNYEG